MVHRLTALGLMACLAALAVASAADEKPRPAVKRVEFEGTWDGKYKPTGGVAGKGKYEFGEEKDGKWDITVTWDEGTETKSMPVKGERLGPDALRLEGTYQETTYWYLGRKEGEKIVFRYLSVNKKTGMSGTGVSELTRPK